MYTSEQFLRGDTIHGSRPEETQPLLKQKESSSYYLAWLYVMLVFSSFALYYFIMIVRNDLHYNHDLSAYYPGAFGLIFFAQFALEILALKKKDSSFSFLALTFMIISLVIIGAWTFFFGSEFIKRTINPPPPSEEAHFSYAMAICFSIVGLIGLIIEGVTIRGAVKKMKTFDQE